MVGPQPAQGKPEGILPGRGQGTPKNEHILSRPVLLLAPGIGEGKDTSLSTRRSRRLFLLPFQETRWPSDLSS